MQLMNSVRIASTVGIAFSFLLLATSIAQPAQGTSQSSPSPIPLPVTPRTRPVTGHVFDRPSLIVLVKLFEKTQVESTDSHGVSLPGAEKKAPFWTYVRTQVLDVIRVNERKPEDPDLKDWYLWIEQKGRGEKPIPLEFAREYLVMLTPSPTFMAFWKPERSDLEHLPPYAFAIPQGGFEITGGTARPLVKGGPLDAYDGMPSTKLLEEIRKR